MVSTYVLASDHHNVYEIFTGDHIFGIGPLIAACLNGAGGMVEGVADPRLNAQPDNIAVSNILSNSTIPK